MFGINDSHRKVLADSIRSWLEGEDSFKNTIAEKSRFMDWARRIENGTEQGDELWACHFLAYLPYTQPPADDDPIRFATWCAAVVLCNEGGFNFSYAGRDKKDVPGFILENIL